MMGWQRKQDEKRKLNGQKDKEESMTENGEKLDEYWIDLGGEGYTLVVLIRL